MNRIFTIFSQKQHNIQLSLGFKIFQKKTNFDQNLLDNNILLHRVQNKTITNNKLFLILTKKCQHDQAYQSKSFSLEI